MLPHLLWLGSLARILLRLRVPAVPSFDVVRHEISLECRCRRENGRFGLYCFQGRQSCGLRNRCWLYVVVFQTRILRNVETPKVQKTLRYLQRWLLSPDPNRSAPLLNTLACLTGMAAAQLSRLPFLFSASTLIFFLHLFSVITQLQL